MSRRQGAPALDNPEDTGIILPRVEASDPACDGVIMPCTPGDGSSSSAGSSGRSTINCDNDADTFQATTFQHSLDLQHANGRLNAALKATAASEYALMTERLNNVDLRRQLAEQQQQNQQLAQQLAQEQRRRQQLAKELAAVGAEVSVRREVKREMAADIEALLKEKRQLKAQIKWLTRLWRGYDD